MDNQENKDSRQLSKMDQQRQLAESITLSGISIDLDKIYVAGIDPYDEFGTTKDFSGSERWSVKPVKGKDGK